MDGRDSGAIVKNSNVSLSLSSLIYASTLPSPLIAKTRVASYKSPELYLIASGMDRVLCVQVLPFKCQ